MNVFSVCCVSGGSRLLDKVRDKFWVGVGIDGNVGVAAKGLYHVGQARPKFVLVRSIPRDANTASTSIIRTWDGDSSYNAAPGRDEKGKHRPRSKESHDSLPILTASSHGIRCLCPITVST